MAAPFLRTYDSVAEWLKGAVPQAVLLLFVRIVLAGIFWRAGRSKVEEDSWLTPTDSTRELFHTEYAGVPFPPDIAMVMAIAAEHILPALLIAGLFTRGAAAGIIGMTLVIQFFVYPDAWWSVHALWVALAAILVMRGGGLLSLDALLLRVRRP